MQSAFLKCKSWLCLWVWNTSVVSVCHILAIVSKNIGSWYLIPNRITHSSGWRKKKTYVCVKIHLNKNIKTIGSKSFEQHVDSPVGSKYWSRILSGALLLWQIMVACHYGRVVVLCHCARVMELRQDCSSSMIHQEGWGVMPLWKYRSTNSSSMQV